eukprot:8353801-Prorocentrum_lima.AAC.1
MQVGGVARGGGHLCVCVLPSRIAAPSEGPVSAGGNSDTLTATHLVGQWVFAAKASSPSPPASMEARKASP